MKKIWIYGLFCLVAGISTVTVTASASAAVSAETAFIFNTLSFLIHGFLVMWMAAGFCMLEAGLVRSKNTAMQCSKNIGLYSIAGIMYWLIGYNLMYSGVDAGYIGTPSPWSAADPSITADGFKADDSNVYSAGSDWFPDGFCRRCGVNSVRNCRREGQGILFSSFYRRFNGRYLPNTRLLDVGRRMALGNGLFGLRGVNNCPFSRRLGRINRGYYNRCSKRQIWRRRAS